MHQNVKTFLESTIILDTETTSVEVETTELVELAMGVALWDPEGKKSWATWSKLYGTMNPIPPEASAVHFISNRMVAGLPKFTDQLDEAETILTNGNTARYLVAHNAEFDRNVLLNIMDNNSPVKRMKQFREKETWVCTWRLAKSILNIDYNRIQYNLSFLRYYLDLPVSDELTAHRAEADVTTCACLLEELINIGINKGKIDPDKEIGPQLVRLCYTPSLVETWPFGKHKGKKLADIPTDYYDWACDNLDALNEKSGKYDSDLAYSVEKILESRL